MSNYYRLGKKCPACGKSITDRATYCQACYKIGKRNPQYKNSLPKSRKLDKKCPNCGKEITDYAAYCQFCSRRGKRNYGYKHGLDDLSIGHSTRGRDHIVDYAKWMKDVLERDEFQCRHCGSNQKLRVHHINSFAKYPELRLIVENGITLCEYHHKQLHQLFGNDVTPEQLQWFFDNVK